MNSASSFTRTTALGIALLIGSSMRGAEVPKITWEKWGEDIFTRAKAENRFVLLDLGAGWCHWCHVMDEVTYADPAVVGLVQGKYIAVHVDQDQRPDLANRYEDYGWPATIIFDVDGNELVKRSGYIPPKPMASLLQAVIDDPTPGPSVQPEPVVIAASESTLTEEQRKAMRLSFASAYDREHGGWGNIHKYLDWDALEYCVTEGAAGDDAMRQMATLTLTNGSKLFDPVWGGVYQYSTDGDWDHPHYEKIMPFQAETLRILSITASLRQEPSWLASAQKIRSYLKTLLTSPEGAFYTSQDADLVPGKHSAEYFAMDDTGRRKLGVPKVDRHVFARENGLAITGLCALYAASGDSGCLDEARRAADWVIAHRSLEGGGFRHDESDAIAPFLADTLAMARGFLALYTVTAERPWLDRAEKAAAFIDAKFRAPVGFVTASAATASLPSRPQVDENIALTRFANLLFHHTGNAAYRAMADHGMRYLASPVIVEKQGFSISGILLADRELRTEPAHLTIVGAKDDVTARLLFATAIKNAPTYARIEWHDAKEGRLPRNDIDYPPLKTAAAFYCAKGVCSAPIQSPEQLAQKITASRP